MLCPPTDMETYVVPLLHLLRLASQRAASVLCPLRSAAACRGSESGWSAASAPGLFDRSRSAASGTGCASALPPASGRYRCLLDHASGAAST